MPSSCCVGGWKPADAQSQDGAGKPQTLDTVQEPEWKHTVQEPEWKRTLAPKAAACQAEEHILLYKQIYWKEEVFHAHTKITKAK